MNYILEFFREQTMLKLAKSLSFLGFLFLFACSAPAYIPNTINSPMFLNSGEIQGAGYFGTSGMEGHMAFSALDHYAIMLNGTYSWGDSLIMRNYANHLYYEAAPGFFASYDFNDHLVFEKYGFEAFAGMGYGEFETGRKSYFLGYEIEDHQRGNYFKYFLQFGGHINSNNIYVGPVLRVTYLDLKHLGGHTGAFMLEPALIIKGGVKQIKEINFNVHIGSSAMIDAGKAPFTHKSFVFSLGLQYSLGRNRVYFPYLE